MVKNFLIAYDVFDPKKLTKIKKKAYSVSIGGQKSALETLLSYTEARKLFLSLQNSIDTKSDKINIVEVEKEPIYLGVRPQIIIIRETIII